MPTKYKAILDHVPLDCETDLNAIAAHVERCCEAVQNLLVRCGADPQDVDLERILTDAITILTRFALDCNALPQRTPKMLMATASKIAQNPQEFLDTSEGFDPEVNAMVWDEVVRQTSTSWVTAAKFELGIGSGPPPTEIAQAANNVRIRLKAKAGQQGRGRPHLELQTDLALDLGRIFRAQGGRITRITFDGESGPFHEFLELLLPAVRPFAKDAGFDLTITTMVEKAQTYRDGKPRKNNGISATQLIP